VKSQEIDDILLRGRLGSDGLYMFPALGLQAAKSSISLPSGPYVNSVSYINNSFCIADSSQYMWHMRLGHPNSHTLKLVLQHCKNFPSNKDVSQFCTACCMGKAHRLHSPSSNTTYTHRLELIFSDL